MQCPEYGEHRQRSCYDISEEKQEEQEIADQQDRFPRVIVHYISAERPYDQGHQRIAGQCHAYSVVACPESFAKIQGQKRHYERKREIQKKVSRPDLEIIAVPEFVRHIQVFSMKKSRTAVSAALLDHSAYSELFADDASHFANLV